MSKDEDWGVDDVIAIQDATCSQLPNSPTCPALVGLYLTLPRLTMIPPSFFDCMPMLKVLGLYNTNIMSFPPSISKLTLLERFFLRDCSALMEIPPQIGELKKLKFFVVEGSEIMYIPEEIGNLKDLEYLKISLSAHADHYIKTKDVNKPIIPRMMISKLTKLKELSIDVNPEAEWWENEVKAIQNELCHLVDLETLNWYIPTAEVLQQFLQLERNGVAIYASLSDFTITIGQHAQLTSCLPRDLEKNFEKFFKCLKCTNDEGSMNDISRIIRGARALLLHHHWSIERLSVFNIRKLKHCLLVECNEMQTLVEADDVSRDGESDTENGEKYVLGSLQYLGIHNMKKLQSIWRGPIGKNSLSCLTVLALHTCPEFTTVLTQNVVENLVSLIELIVEDCAKVKSIISIESPKFNYHQCFPSLKKIALLDLPELVSICSGQVIAPELDSLTIYNCPKLQCLSTIELRHTKEIKGESEWWDVLNLDKSMWNDIFVQLKKQRDLVEQLTEITNSLQHFHYIMEIHDIRQWLEEDGGLKQKLHSSHPQQVFECEKEETDYVCDGCKEYGFGIRYKCDNNILHPTCMFKSEAITHHFYKGSVFKLYDKAPYQTVRRCDACAWEIKGFGYHNESSYYRLHPSCTSLPDVVSINGVKYFLHNKQLVCDICRHTGIWGRGWSYASYKENYHIGCMKRQVLMPENSHKISKMEPNQIRAEKQIIFKLLQGLGQAPDQPSSM